MDIIHLQTCLRIRYKDSMCIDIDKSLSYYDVIKRTKKDLFDFHYITSDDSYPKDSYT